LQRLLPRAAKEKPSDLVEESPDGAGKFGGSKWLGQISRSGGHGVVVPPPETNSTFIFGRIACRRSAISVTGIPGITISLINK